MTPYFEADGVTLYYGDCLEVIAECIQSASIDLTVTSPPYDNLRAYNGYVFDFDGIAEQLRRVTNTGGVIVWVVGDATVNGSETGTSFRQALRFMELGFNLHDTMIYEKNGPSYPDSVRYYQVFEYMFIFSNGSPKSVNLISDRENKYLFPWGRKTQRDNDVLVERKHITKENRLDLVLISGRYLAAEDFQRQMRKHITTAPYSRNH